MHIAQAYMDAQWARLVLSPVVDGHDLVRAADELGVQGALDGLLHQAVPGAAGKLARLPIDGLAVALTDLKHERPIGSGLLLAVRCLSAITLHDQLANVTDLLTTELFVQFSVSKPSFCTSAPHMSLIR